MFLQTEGVKGCCADMMCCVVLCGEKMGEVLVGYVKSNSEICGPGGLVFSLGQGLFGPAG